MIGLSRRELLGIGAGAFATGAFGFDAEAQPAKSRSNCVMIGWPFSFNVFSENATSCAVSGLPSWNFASGRSRKR